MLSWLTINRESLLRNGKAFFFGGGGSGLKKI